MNIDHVPHTRLLALLNRYGAKVHGLIKSQDLGRYGIDAADVEQELRIRLWKALARDMHEIRAGYLQRIALACVIDAIRAANARLTSPLPGENSDSFSDFAETASGPEENACKRQFLDMLTTCVAAFPRQRRAAVALHLQGYSVSEIGELTHTNYDCARKRRDRGLRMLRDQLAVAGFGA